MPGPMISVPSWLRVLITLRKAMTAPPARPPRPPPGATPPSWHRKPDAEKGGRGGGLNRISSITGRGGEAEGRGADAGRETQRWAGQLNALPAAGNTALGWSAQRAARGARRGGQGVGDPADGRVVVRRGQEPRLER